MIMDIDQAVIDYPKGVSVVYFVQIGRHVKIGFTTNLRDRLRSFGTTAVAIDLLLVIPGTMSLERQLHDLLKEVRAARELFHFDARMEHFFGYYQAYGLDRAIEYLTSLKPEVRRAARDAERKARVLAARLTREQENAYYASLVTERKRATGR